MFRRRLTSGYVLLLVSLMFLSGCSPAQLATLEAPTTPAQPTATQTSTSAPISTATSSPGNSSILRVAKSCMLITSNDLAHLFPPHNEIVRNPPQTVPVSHPPFSEVAASGTETTCLFYDFHQPGSLAGWMLQVTYLVDVPDPAAAQAWSQAWAKSKADSGQAINGLVDEAFASGANLYVKQGDIYISFESTDTRLDANTVSGAQQLLAYEEQLAEAGFGRLK